MADDGKLVPLVVPQGPTGRAARELEMVREKAAEALSGAVAVLSEEMAAAELNDDGSHVEGETALDVTTGRPKGWSARKYRVARDGRKNRKDAPHYLKDAVGITAAHLRATNEGFRAPELNGDIKVLVQGGLHVYQTLVVDDGE